jgi:hypothetical protein
MHLAQRVCQSWKTCWNPFFDIVFRTASALFRTAVEESKRWPRSSDFRRGNRKKWHGARSGLYGGCGTQSMFFRAVTVLKTLAEHIRRKRPELHPSRWRLNHDNARPHVSNVVAQYLARKNTECVPARLPGLADTLGQLTKYVRQVGHCLTYLVSNKLILTLFWLGYVKLIGRTIKDINIKHKHKTVSNV